LSCVLRLYRRAKGIQDRPIFYHLIENELKENDLLLLTKIDRCSRNTFEFLKLQKKLFDKSVTFIALELPFSNDMAVNQLIVSISDEKLLLTRN
jgi:DNA invertase Pin-like site-specific DNA recombinase